MRVLAIRGRNLASLEGEFSIDFTEEPLASAGIFAISGPTGAGKSTLLRCLTLLERPTSGQIMLAGQDIASLSGAQLRAARRAVIGIDPVERDGDVRIHPAVHRVAVRAHPELRIVEQLAQAGGERVGVTAVDDRIRLLAHRRVQHGGDARVRAAVWRSVRQDG